MKWVPAWCHPKKPMRVPVSSSPVLTLMRFVVLLSLVVVLWVHVHHDSAHWVRSALFRPWPAAWGGGIWGIEVNDPTPSAIASAPARATTNPLMLMLQTRIAFPNQPHTGNPWRDGHHIVLPEHTVWHQGMVVASSTVASSTVASSAVASSEIVTSPVSQLPAESGMPVEMAH